MSQQLIHKFQSWCLDGRQVLCKAALTSMGGVFGELLVKKRYTRSFTMRSQDQTKLPDE